MTNSKACTRCKQILPLDTFGKNSKTKSGYGARCISCCREVDRARLESRREQRAEYLANWRAENQDHIKAYRVEYYELNADAIKEKVTKWYYENLEQAKATRKLYAIENAEYLAQMALEWQRANPDKVAASNKRYKLAHPEKARESDARRRALMYENGVYFIRHKEIKRLYSSPCFYCGTTENIEADHVLAVKRTGCHGISNLLPACRSCNGSKGERTIMEWRVWKAKREAV